MRMLTDADLRTRIIPAAQKRVVRDFNNKPLIRDLAAVYRKEIEAFRHMALTET